MADMYPLSPGEPAGQMPPIIIQNQPPKQPWLGRTLLKVGLVVSILINFSLFGMHQQYYPNVTANEQFRTGDQYAPNKVAIIKVDGIILSQTIAKPKKELETAAKDKEVKAVVLSVVDCPGGTISGSDELYHAIEEFKSKTQKPLVVAMQGMAASGGYYISVPADKIYADRSCVTGSIGVITSLFNIEGLLKQWGIAPEVIKSGKMKDSGSFYRAMTPEERKEWQEMVDGMFEQFLGVVIKYRDNQVGGMLKLREIADGRIYRASEAKDLGLIDEIGYLEDAIEGAKQLAGLSGSPVRVVTYSRPLGVLSTLLGVEAKASPVLDLRRVLELQVPRILLMPAAPILTRD